MDPTQTFESRRKHPRHRLRDAVSVINQNTGASVGLIANLSQEGIMLVNSAPLHADCIYQVCLFVEPGVIDGSPDGHRIEMGIDCLWNSPAEGTAASTYWSGCQIIDIAEKDFELVQKLIALAAVKD